MKILYGIQGTGNGHLGRALEIIPHLKKYADVDILLSGTQVDLHFPFDLKYRKTGLSFVFGKKGGVDILNTYLKSDSRRLLREIRSIPIEQYNLVINDFEPVSAWAAYLKGVPCAALSNQAAIFTENAPIPSSMDFFGKFILKRYAPSDSKYGLHFKKFNEQVFTPIIRQEIRKITPSKADHYTVYLPSYDDERIIRRLKKFKDIRWEVFSKHTRTSYKVKNIAVFPVQRTLFTQSMAKCSGIITAAGFGTTSEALFLEKKLLVVPMKTQYEQMCNAAALESMGVPIMKNLKKKHEHLIERWLNNGPVVKVDYPDNADEIVTRILADHGFPDQPGTGIKLS